MSSRQSFLITGAPLGIGVHADSFASRDSSTALAPLGRPRTKIVERARAHRGRNANTLLQGFLGASMLLHKAMEQIPAGYPSQPALGALRLVRRAIAEARAAIWGFQVTLPPPSSLEQTLADFLAEVTPARRARPRIFVLGKSRALQPAIQEQVFLICREAVVNALCHSAATKIEVEIQYLRNLLCILVRDNGCGINPEAILSTGDSHSGLRGMCERAGNIGARLGVWSRVRAGTEVRVTVPVDVVKAHA